MEAQKSAPIWEESSEEPEFGQGISVILEQLHGWRSNFSLNGKEAEEQGGYQGPGSRDQGPGGLTWR